MSEIIYIAGTNERPSIYFDSSYQLRITGCSIPEDVWDVYGGVTMRILKLTEKTPGLLNCEFTLEYCNRSSLECILDIFKLIRIMKNNGWQIQVKWYYQEFDEDMKEAGEVYSKILEHSFILIENKDLITEDSFMS